MLVLLNTSTCGRRRSGPKKLSLAGDVPVLRLHDRAARLVGLVVDVEPAQRRLVGELVLGLDREHVGRVDDAARCAMALGWLFSLEAIGPAIVSVGHALEQAEAGRRWRPDGCAG